MIICPADLREDTVQDGDEFDDMRKLGKMEMFQDNDRRDESAIMDATAERTEETESTIGNTGRVTFVSKLCKLKDLVEDPREFESKAKEATKQSSFVHGDSDSNTLIIVSAEQQIVEELKQAVATSKKQLRLHVLDFIPPKILERGGDAVELRRIQSPSNAPGQRGRPAARRQHHRP